ncbi:hypothetical protein [Hippea alviniae]|uniref:hypothetical protein n=1 Tax=Hippea alviniae TaxID=1279027 RepID=UPI0003B7564F|nr:hypothetical protein [Hippea alviniae]
MEGVNSLQKKIAKGVILFITLFVLSVEAAEIVNFVYLVPFSIAFFLFLNAAETELHSESFNFVIPFLYGIIADIISLKRLFVLCLGFVLFSYLIFYLIKAFALNKQHVFITVCFIYAVFVFFVFDMPLWVSLFVFALSFLQWRLASLITSLIITDRHSGEA